MNNTLQKSSYHFSFGDLLLQDEPHPMIFNEPHSNSNSHDKFKILEQYYNDIYKLFLTKLAKFDSSASTTDADRKKLKSLIDEIIYIKALIEEER